MTDRVRRDADVIISGYGPVGATAANFLGAEGLDVIVVERDPTVYSRARAISTDEEVLRVWQRIGLAERLEADMLGDRQIDYVDAAGRSFMSFELRRRGNGHPTQMFIYQPALDEVIRDGLDRYPNVRVLLEHESGAVRQGNDGVELDVTDLDTGDTSTLRASWLLACDGGSSDIRTQLGIGFEGRTHEDPWVVIDTKVKHEWPEVDRLRFHCDPERPAVDCPTPLGHHRWEFPIFPWEDREEVSGEAAIWRMLGRLGITDENVEILRRAVYVHHVRFAEHWRQDRVFLLGDAAHCMPPWIGQGMAAGVRDAGNLSWKLAHVIRGEADEAILDTYEAERQPHVRKVTDAAVFFGRVITERRRPLVSLRNAGFGLAMKTPLVGDYIRSGSWFPESDYGRGFADRGSRREFPFVGRQLPQPLVRVPGSDEPVLLDEVLGRGWAIVSRTDRALAAWDGLARCLVIGRDFTPVEPLLDELLGTADAVVVRPDRCVFAAAADGAPLPPPPAELFGPGASAAAVPPPANAGERLLAAAADRLDDRVLELVFGSPLALAAIFKEMAGSFVPRVANGFKGEIEYDLRRRIGGTASWTVRIEGGRAVARHGRSAAPALRIGIGLSDFLRMAAGELDQVELLEARRIELEGDGLLASRLGPMFGRPAPIDRYVAPRSVDPPPRTVKETDNDLQEV